MVECGRGEGGTSCSHLQVDLGFKKGNNKVLYNISEYAFPPLERMQIFSVDSITVLQMRPLKKTFCPALIPHRSSGDGEDSL